MYQCHAPFGPSLGVGKKLTTTSQNEKIKSLRLDIFTIICRPGLEEKHRMDITRQKMKGQGRVREIKRAREGGQG